MTLLLGLSLITATLYMAAGVWQLGAAVREHNRCMLALGVTLVCANDKTCAQLKRIELSFDALTHQIQCK